MPLKQLTPQGCRFSPQRTGTVIARLIRGIECPTLGSGAKMINSGHIDVSTISATSNTGRIMLLGETVTSSSELRAYDC